MLEPLIDQKLKVSRLMSIQKSLVLIVGAGASKEADLPVGSELKRHISRVLNFKIDHQSPASTSERVLFSAFKLATSFNPSRPDINLYLNAARRVSDAMPQALSIDNFIDSHRSDEAITLSGKLAIAWCILEAESKSILTVDRRNIYNKLDFSKASPTWFNAFFQILTENCQESDLPDRLSKVAIICFNYDRCLEHYLHSSFQNYYGMKVEDSIAALARIEIYHPYGTVGKLPWQHKDGVDFGVTPEPMQLYALAGELRTFSEGVDPSKSDILEIRSLVESAERIAFLGFAFHRLNMQLLFSPPAGLRAKKSCKIYATAHGISTSDVREIEAELSDFGHLQAANIFLRNDLRCAELFHEFWRSLSLS
ncbi:MAG: hypothetical protein ABJC13_24360 [Acidobacteriota bacterium]